MKLSKIVAGKVKAVTLKANDPHKFDCPVMGEVLAKLKVGGPIKETHAGPVVCRLDLTPKFDCPPEIWVYVGPTKDVSEDNYTWFWNSG